MKKVISSELSTAQLAELAALDAMPESGINTDDIPERRDWTGARRGVFFRPVKQQLRLRLEADLIDWFKTRTPGGEGYQTRINSALREFVGRQGQG